MPRLFEGLWDPPKLLVTVAGILLQSQMSLGSAVVAAADLSLETGTLDSRALVFHNSCTKNLAGNSGFGC